jgi:hypothetical protein
MEKRIFKPLISSKAIKRQMRKKLRAAGRV